MKRISKSDQVRAAKKLLADEGYMISSLWSIGDVQEHYNVTDLVAMEILEESIGGNENLSGEVFSFIDEAASRRGLIKKE
jgi:hypothetical protein